MSRHLLGWLVGFVVVLLPQCVWGQNPATKTKEDILALSRRIDALIDARCKEAGVAVAPAASDSEYFRRLHLDLAGRIPNLIDARDFVDKQDPNKRWDWVSKLLGDETYSQHFANVWRAHLLWGGNTQFTQGLTPSFELWLSERLKANIGYDRMAHEILVSGPNNQAFMGNGQMTGSPLAFYQGNENKPENLAGASSRVFLGVKLECAQCHAHPFAKWTREQFWGFAAFFGGTPQQNFRGAFQQPAVDPTRREIQIPGTNKTVKAKFLNGQEPAWKQSDQPRQVLADWIASADNPYFARATADQLWSYFFGVSLLEPIMEPSDDQTIIHPQLLDELARDLVAHKFDLKYLIQAIVHTRAYQRTTVAKGKVSHEEFLLFARMPVRGLSPEQLYDSVIEAIDYEKNKAKDNTPINNRVFFNQPQTPRGQFLAKFTSQDKRNETQTSILQALFMMNGKYLEERLNPDNNESLAFLIRQKTTAAEKVDTLFLMVLSRLPRAEERTRLSAYIDSGNPRRTIADVYWALLNSAEFMLNH